MNPSVLVLFASLLCRFQVFIGLFKEIVVCLKRSSRVQVDEAMSSSVVRSVRFGTTVVGLGGVREIVILKGDIFMNL